MNTTTMFHFSFKKKYIKKLKSLKYPHMQKVRTTGHVYYIYYYVLALVKVVCKCFCRRKGTKEFHHIYK